MVPNRPPHKPQFTATTSPRDPMPATCECNSTPTSSSPYTTQTGDKHPITARLQSLNLAIRKQRKMHFFHTLNNAKIIWDSRSKPKGLLIGHINIHSIIGKIEQIEHLLNNSNIDILAISESWLTHSSPTAPISISGYNVFRRDRGIGRGVDYWFL